MDMLIAASSIFLIFTGKLCVIFTLYAYCLKKTRGRTIIFWFGAGICSFAWGVVLATYHAQ